MPRCYKNTAELEELMLRDAHNHFERREVELGEMTMREVERQVLLGLSINGGANIFMKWTICAKVSIYEA